jgi:hypothetical protein
VEFVKLVLGKLNDTRNGFSRIENINWHCLFNIQKVKLNKQLELFLLDPFDTEGSSCICLFSNPL